MSAPSPTVVSFKVCKGWPTPNNCRKVAGALDALGPARYGDILRAYADAEDARYAEHGPIAQALADAGVLGPEQARTFPDDYGWSDLMVLLDAHWPDDLFPTLPDTDQRDPGPRIVSLLRWVDRLKADVKALADRAEWPADDDQTLRAALARWQVLYREAVGVPAAEHTERRMEALAQAVEAAVAETASIRNRIADAIAAREAEYHDPPFGSYREGRRDAYDDAESIARGES